MTLKTIYRWPIRQLTGFIAGLRGLLARIIGNPLETLPPSISSTIRWLLKKFPEAFGFSTPNDQILASFVLVIFALLSSLITFGATLVLVGVFIFTLFVGVLRLVPVVNHYWPLN